MKKKLIYGVAITASIYGAYLVGCCRGALYICGGIAKSLKKFEKRESPESTFVYANYMEDFGDDELNELLS